MLSELSGEGWQFVEPPWPQDGENALARMDGEPIKGGILVERIEDSQDKFHALYRTGPYDVEIKVDFVSGHGQVRVTDADGYEFTDDE